MLSTKLRDIVINDEPIFRFYTFVICMQCGISKISFVFRSKKLQDFKIQPCFTNCLSNLKLNNIQLACRRHLYKDWWSRRKSQWFRLNRSITVLKWDVAQNSTEPEWLLLSTYLQLTLYTTHCDYTYYMLHKNHYIIVLTSYSCYSCHSDGWTKIFPHDFVCAEVEKTDISVYLNRQFKQLNIQSCKRKKNQ